MDTEVIIVGAGPVGLTLAIALGQLGRRCVVLERNKAPAFLPKMERCNPRAMEIFRRLGLADRIRAASYPTSASMDIAIITRMVDPPLAVLKYPSVDEARRLARESNDGTHPLEPSQVISQYTLEPLLKAAAEETEGVSVRFGHEVTSFEQDANGVVVQVLREDGSTFAMRGQYLVGCDGGTSFVRKQLGVALLGQAQVAELRQVLYRCPGLLDKLPHKARHYHGGDAFNSSVVVQDDLEHFSVLSRAPLDSDFIAMFRDLSGLDVTPTIRWVGEFRLHLMVAGRYSDRRVFIAGDAAHLVIPTGALGMNTGVGDALDLAWKLAATLAGWGGPGLLPAYDVERRMVGLRNIEASRYGSIGMNTWRAAYRPNIRDESPEGAETRRIVAELASVEQRKVHEMAGIELGYRYVSPLICNEPADGPDPHAKAYTPSTWSGSRLPHMWLSDGSAIFDHLGKGFTLLKLGGTRAETSGLEAAVRATGAPLLVLERDEAALRDVYERDLLLVRPDGHVAWRGNAAPRDPAYVAGTVTGHASAFF